MSVYDSYEPDEDHTEERAALVSCWAALLDRPDVLILDTETTGLDCPEIVDIGVIDTRGCCRMDRLVLPAGGHIEPGAVHVHGITLDRLREENAPRFGALVTGLQQLVDGAYAICIYNAGFDLGAINVSLRANGLSNSLAETMADKERCIMLDYAFLSGEWHDYWEGWAWCKLTEAAAREGVPRTGAHRALADCRMVLGIMRAVVARGAAA